MAGPASHDTKELPSGWELRPLNRISPKQSVGLVINPSTYFDPSATVPMLVGSHVAEGRISWENANRISAASNASLSASRLSAGDIVVVRVGEPGVAAVVPPELDGCNCASMMIVRQHASFDSRWLCAVMNSRIGRAQIENVQYGTAQKQFNISDAVNFVYPSPPLAEQRAIAATLADVDALIAAFDQLIAKKRDIKTATMQQLLTGQRRLPGFTDAWVTRRLGEVFSFLRTAHNPRADLSAEGDVGYVHYGDIHTSPRAFLDVGGSALPRIRSSFVIGANRVEDGDLIMADASEDYDGIGKCVEVSRTAGMEVVAGLHTFLLRGDKQQLADGFKGYLQFIPAVRSSFVRLATGISVYGISKNNVKNVEVALPSVAEQQAIAEVLRDMEAERDALEARREKTKLIKQGMMQELLTGRTRLVRDAS